MKGYARRVRIILIVVLGLNAAVAAGKLYAGWRANSLSVIGDGLHSSVDALANVVALMILHFATRPADEDHPFGHAKYETIAAFALSGIMLLTAYELAERAVSRFMTPGETHITSLTVGMMIATLLVNIIVSTAERREAHRTGSDLLRADAAQTRMDVYVTLAILASFPLQRMGYAGLDAILAFAVSLFIAYAAYAVVRDAFPVLTDRVVYDPADVARIVMEVPGVENVHDIRSRGHPREAFLQMHLVVEPDDVATAHEIADEVERRLGESLGVKEVFIHIEPEDDGSGPPGSNPDIASA